MNGFLVLAIFISTVSAHFKVYSPKFRPGTGKPELISPCGNIPLGARTEFPIVGGVINGNYGHNGTGHISAVVSETDPTAAQFQKYFINDKGANATFSAGNFSVPVDFSNVPGAKDGAPVTVQMVLYDGPTIFHLCGDLTLKDNRPAPSYGAASATTTAAAATTEKAYVAPPSTGLYSGANGVMAVTATTVAALLLSMF
ncbi:hypothetical protein BDR26DRAFT_857135 [Obelidium mucronatum]|nr:hypothetical protein BDR26DRAFT_857135 [Obelidium mucronatum]